jgi:hypothetical protein
MRRIIFGLALVPFLACSSASAGEGPALAGSDGIPKAEAPPPDEPAHAAKVAKRMPKRQSQPAAASLSLQSAETHAADHSAGSPTSSAAKPASPAASSWTGFYVGAGGGIGRQ